MRCYTAKPWWRIPGDLPSRFNRFGRLRACLLPSQLNRGVRCEACSRDRIAWYRARLEIACPCDTRVQISLSAPNNHRLLARFANQRLSKPALSLLHNKAEGSLNQTRTGHYSAIQPLSSSVQIDLEAPPEEIGPLQLIAKASCAALELAIAGMNEAAIELLASLAEIW